MEQGAIPGEQEPYQVLRNQRAGTRRRARQQQQQHNETEGDEERLDPNGGRGAMGQEIDNMLIDPTGYGADWAAGPSGAGSLDGSQDRGGSTPRLIAGWVSASPTLIPSMVAPLHWNSSQN